MRSSRRAKKHDGDNRLTFEPVYPDMSAGARHMTSVGGAMAIHVLAAVALAHAGPTATMPTTTVEVTFVPPSPPPTPPPPAPVVPGPAPGNPDEVVTHGGAPAAVAGTPKPGPRRRAAPAAAPTEVAVAAPVADTNAPVDPTPTPHAEDDGGKPDAGTGPGAGGTGQGTGAGRGNGNGGPGGDASGVATPPVPLEDYASIILPYTRRAIDADVSGDVVLDLAVDEEGHVVSMRIVRRLGYGLDEIGAGIAAKFRFRPGRDALGRPVAAHVGWVMQFHPPR